MLLRAWVWLSGTQKDLLSILGRKRVEEEKKAGEGKGGESGKGKGDRQLGISTCNPSTWEVEA